MLALITYFFKESDKRTEELLLKNNQTIVNMDILRESFSELRGIIKSNLSLRLTIYGGIAVNFI